MNRHFFILLLCNLPLILHAQQNTSDSSKHIREPIQKFYVGNGLDAAIFSTAIISHTVNGATTNTMGTLRFSGFFNAGLTFNFNLARHFGIYTGIDVKNIGFIEHTNGLVIKRRTYNLGAPLGLKLGNMRRHGAYVFLGGGADIPLNFKEKQFQIRSQKTKVSEWFSSRTPAVMPYVFIGFTASSGITFKAQYYPNNYLNPDFNSATESYTGYNVQLMMFSVGIRINYSKSPSQVKKSVEETKVM